MFFETAKIPCLAGLDPVSRDKYHGTQGDSGAGAGKTS